jgi:hypothetical protein
MAKIYAAVASVFLVLALTWPGEAKPKRFPGIPAEWYHSTCQIVVDGLVAGSGFAVGDGEILTAAHVLIGSDVAVQYRRGGSWRIHSTEIVAVDAVFDLALLKIAFSELQAAPLADRATAWGDPVAIVGCAQRHEPMPFAGHWGDRVPAWVDEYRPGLRAVTAPNWFGNSGAPVWDLNQGAICGMTSCRDRDFANLAYVTPATILQTFWEGARNGNRSTQER